MGGLSVTAYKFQSVCMYELIQSPLLPTQLLLSASLMSRLIMILSVSKVCLIHEAILSNVLLSVNISGITSID